MKGCKKPSRKGAVKGLRNNQVVALDRRIGFWKLFSESFRKSAKIESE